MAALVFILYELFPLDSFSSCFVCASLSQYKLDCMFVIMQISRTGHDIVPHLRETAFHTVSVTTPCSFYIDSLFAR